MSLVYTQRGTSAVTSLHLKLDPNYYECCLHWQDLCGRLLRSAMKEAGRMRGDDLAAVTFLLATSSFQGRERDIDDLVYTLKLKLVGGRPL